MKTAERESAGDSSHIFSDAGGMRGGSAAIKFGGNLAQFSTENASVANGVLSAQTSQSPDTYGFAGDSPSISSNNGNNAVVWTVTDIHGNSATCTQLVIVVDNEAPTITCPADITVSSGSFCGVGSAIVTFPMPVARREHVRVDRGEHRMDLVRPDPPLAHELPSL